MNEPDAPASALLARFVLPGLLLASSPFVATGCGPGGGGGASTWQIVFTLADTLEDLETVVISVAYTGGNFVGSGSTVACDLVHDDDGESADFDDDDSGKLTADIDAADRPLTEGDDVVACTFQSGQEPSPDDFTVTIDDADPADPEDVEFSVDVRSIAAEGDAP